MKKQVLSLLALLALGTIDAQTVGDPTLGSASFSNSALMYTGKNQYHPKVFYQNGAHSVVWGQGTSGEVGLFRTDLNSSYAASGGMDTVVGFTGNQMTDPTTLNHVMTFDSIAGKYLSVYETADKPTVINYEFTMKAKLYSDTDQSGSEIIIEGPFDYTTDMPHRASVAVSSNSKFCVAYHSDGGSSTNSVIRVKIIDAATGTVTPTATANSQNGYAVTFPGAQYPDVAWNESAGVFGIVYTIGSGNNQKIKFVSVDETGTVVTAEKDVINDNSISVEFPKIIADGNSFIIAWRDYRSYQLPGETGLSGIPQTRVASLDAQGNVNTLTGDALFFDSNDNSLLISNPYLTGTYLYIDLVVAEAGSKYGVVWATQDSPQEIRFAEVHLNGTTIGATVPVSVNENGVQSNVPTIAYNNGDYIITHQGYTGTGYENRIAVGQVSPSGSSIGENSFKIETYPNPTHSTITINSEENITSVIVRDLTGRILESMNPNSYNVLVDLSSFPVGVYLVEVNESEIQKIIKQ